MPAKTGMCSCRVLKEGTAKSPFRAFMVKRVFTGTLNRTVVLKRN